MRRNSFYYFYKYMFRHQIIDKLNITCIQELDLVCTVRVSLIYQKDQSNQPIAGQDKRASELLYFQYLIESFTTQQAVARTVQYPRGSKLAESLGTDHFIEYFVNIPSGKPFFEFISKLWVCIYYKRRIVGGFRKLHLSHDSFNNKLIIRKFPITLAPWLDASLFRHVPVSFRITFTYNNYMLLMLFLSRLQLLGAFRLKSPLTATPKGTKKKYKNRNVGKAYNKKRHLKKKTLHPTRKRD